jgi:amino acid transporter
VAIIVQSTIALILALSGSFVQLAMLSIVARLATYMGTAAAVPVLRRKFPRTESTVRLPGGPLIPIAALVLCVVFLLSATRWNLVAGAIALVVGLLLYTFRRRPVSDSAVPPAG